MVFFGSLATLKITWSLADIMMGLMTICNLIAISLLGRFAILLLKDYQEQKRKGIRNPVFHKKNIPELDTTDVECW